MNTADMNEIMCLAMVSIESGFKRVQIDPEDIIAIIDSRNELLATLKNSLVELLQAEHLLDRGEDDSYNLEPIIIACQYAIKDADK